MSDAPLSSLGNAIVACCAWGCYVVVLVPGVAVCDTTFILVAAFRMGGEALIILGVKLRRRDVGLSETQVDEIYALGYHIALLERGIRVGAVSGKPPEPANRWTAVAYLPPQLQEVFTHVGDAINQLLEKLKVRR